MQDRLSRQRTDGTRLGVPVTSVTCVVAGGDPSPPAAESEREEAAATTSSWLANHVAHDVWRLGVQPSRSRTSLARLVVETQARTSRAPSPCQAEKVDCRVMLANNPSNYRALVTRLREAASMRIHLQVTREAINALASPLSLYERCESAAFVRQALERAARNDLMPPFPGNERLPTSATIALGTSSYRSRGTLQAITGEEHRKQAALNAAAHVGNARIYFEQARVVTESVRPVLYYYGALSFLDFVTFCVVRRDAGTGAHGLSLTADSDGSRFDKDWPRQCRVEMQDTGDFPFFVDALTVAGWPSLFSGFRLHKETKPDPWEKVPNPEPLMSRKLSLALLCGFNFDRYVAERPALGTWLEGADRRNIQEVTDSLVQFVLAFAASSLARYYIPAWRAIVAGEKSSIYNDARAAYAKLAEGMPYFFSEEGLFKHSFEISIP